MDNVITLPDHIKFEEIARYWTGHRRFSHQVLGYYGDHYSFMLISYDPNYELECADIAAFYPDSRELRVFSIGHDDRDFLKDIDEASDGLLDYIKEKSYV